MKVPVPDFEITQLTATGDARRPELARERARCWRQRWPEKHKKRCAAWHDKRDPTRADAMWESEAAKHKLDPSDWFFFVAFCCEARRGPRTGYKAAHESGDRSRRASIP